jgi:hypothetical protein
VHTDTELHVLGLPTKFIPHDPKTQAILARFGLDVDNVVALVRAQ